MTIRLDPSIGRKSDQSKPRFSLVPQKALEDVIDVLEFGAQKYAAENWRFVDNWQTRYYDAAMRHLLAHRRGEYLDEETGKPHLAHVTCCLMFLAELAAEDRPEERQSGILHSPSTHPLTPPVHPLRTGPGSCDPLTHVESPEGHRAWADYHERHMAALSGHINAACDNKLRRDTLQAEYDEHERLAGEHAVKATVGGGDAR